MKLLFNKKILVTLLITLFVALIACGGLAFSFLKSATTNSTPVRIYLPTDENALSARDSILSNNLIDNENVFSLLANILKLDERWHQGSYMVQPHTPVYRLIQRITRGQQDPIRLTIGKFRTPQQLNEYLNRKLMRDDFNVPLDSFHIILPDTYEFYWTVTPQTFMSRMNNEFCKFWSKDKVGPDGKLRVDLIEGSDDSAFSVDDIIILASIVEEETNNNKEKPLIASVYINRLKRGMPLQADPTVKYAVGDFSLRRILNKHLTVDSPFNTYLHTGLPPAPICLPSKASINAVVNAAKTDYLYFCASPDMDGTHRFASTLAEHNRNAAAFHRALNQKGIK